MIIQPAQVLPSNAPPLQDGHAHHNSGVLQEHSGNRQHGYGWTSHAESRYPANLLTENHYAAPQLPHVPQVYRPTLQQRHAWRGASSRHHYENNAGQERNEKTAKFLFQRVKASPQYMKYRERQDKEEKAGQEQKWADRLELAFFQALVKWEPMGRRKFMHKEKQRGRNELIADYIQELTGVQRTRKQVSSHIQVLKPFVEHDPFIMRYLSKEDLGGHPSGRANGPYPSGRRMSNYPVTAVPHNLRNAGPPPPVQNAAFAVPNLAEVRYLMDVFQPMDFSMFVQRKQPDSDVERLHTYTQSIKHPQQSDLCVPDWHTFSQDYSLLASMNTHRPLDCNVVMAEASLAFPTEDWKDKAQVELGISFLCASAHLPDSAQVVCQNSFYRNGQYLEDCSGPNGLCKAQLTTSEDRTKVETQVKFGSTFWAKTLGHLASRLRDTSASSSDPDKDPRREVSAQIQGLHATQEIFVQSEHGSHERILVIYWKFRLSTHPRGRACWQRLMLPSASISNSHHATSAAEELDLPQSAKDDRQDSVYDYNLPFGDTTVSVTTHGLPTLQSPFEYDPTSAGPSYALTPATWPSSHSFDDILSAPQSAIDFPGDNNAFDFTGGNINITYSGADLDFSHFDNSAFDAFDAAIAGGADTFAADPALQDYGMGPAGGVGEQWASFDDSAAGGGAFEDVHAQAHAHAQGQQALVYESPGQSQASQHQVFDAYSVGGGVYDQGFGVHEAQAYGGAGQDVLGGHEDVGVGSLAALADASYLASALHEQTH